MTVQLTIRERITYELMVTRETPFAFFSRVYIEIRKMKPHAPLMIAYANDWEKNQNIPPFIHSYYRKIEEANRVLPQSLLRTMTY